MPNGLFIQRGLMTIDMQEVLGRLKSFRVAKGLRQADMAEQIGVDRSTYVRKERGSIPISTEEWLILSDALGKEISHFFREQGVPAGKEQQTPEETLLWRLLKALRPEEKRYFFHAVSMMFKGVRRKEVASAIDGIRRLKP